MFGRSDEHSDEHEIAVDDGNRYTTLSKYVFRLPILAQGRRLPREARQLLREGGSPERPDRVKLAGQQPWPRHQPS